jgi:copper chaperone CopZ
MDRMEIGIEGMSCGGCVASVERALGSVKGVRQVRVSLERKTAEVEGEGLDRQQLEHAVLDAGYDLRA